MPGRMKIEKEYCRQKNNGAEERMEPGGETVCSGNRIIEKNQHNLLKNSEPRERKMLK